MATDKILTQQIIEQVGLSSAWTDGTTLCAKLKAYLSDEIKKNEVSNVLPKTVLGPSWETVTDSNKKLLSFARRLSLHNGECALIRRRTHQKRVQGRHKSFYAYRLLF